MYERTEFYEKVKERLIRYAKVDTQSDHYGTKTPTTQKQFDLARMLFDELLAIGAGEVRLDETTCVVTAKLGSTMPAFCGRAFGAFSGVEKRESACYN